MTNSADEGDQESMCEKANRSPGTFAPTTNPLPTLAADAADAVGSADNLFGCKIPRRPTVTAVALGNVQVLLSQLIPQSLDCRYSRPLKQRRP